MDTQREPSPSRSFRYRRRGRNTRARIERLTHRVGEKIRGQHRCEHERERSRQGRSKRMRDDVFVSFGQQAQSLCKKKTDAHGIRFSETYN
jgi:hypothetical protein